MKASDSGKADLHLHSNCSDGIYSPEELIQLAASAGLKAVSLTDHDTLAGSDAAAAAGSRLKIEVVPGVEISAHEENLEIHLLGYYPARPEILMGALKQARLDRFRRMELMVRRLNGLGFNLNPDQVCREAAPAAPGRLHLARHMIKEKLVNNLEQAFSFYLEQGRPAYVPRTHLTPAGALALLLDSGAVPVMAHPGLRGRKHLPGLMAGGLRGIEVYHPDHSAALRRYYREFAESNNLLITGGSDFHGDKQYRARGPGSTAIAYRYLQLLKAARFG